MQGADINKELSDIVIYDGVLSLFFYIFKLELSQN